MQIFYVCHMENRVDGEKKEYINLYINVLPKLIPDWNTFVILYLIVNALLTPSYYHDYSSIKIAGFKEKCKRRDVTPHGSMLRQQF